MAQREAATGGDLEAMMDFLALLTSEGRMARATVDSWRSATKAVVEGAQAAGAGSFDVRSLDVDEWVDRFESQSKGKRAAHSLAVYRGRFRRAVEAYRNYLDDPTARPTPRRTARVGEAPAERSSGPGPFVVTLYDGQTAEIRLPPRLTRGDADRLNALLGAMIEALVRD